MLSVSVPNTILVIAGRPLAKYLPLCTMCRGVGSKRKVVHSLRTESCVKRVCANL